MSTTKNESPRVLNPSGALTIERASALRNELMETLTGKGPFLINLSLVDDLDLSCLQVFYAAKRSAVAMGKELHFFGSVPPRIIKRLVASGFLRHFPGKAEEFETGLIDFQ